MKNVNKTRRFDDDFLWLFRKLEKPAICLSLDYDIIELNKAAEELFLVSGEGLLGRHISLLFAPLGLDISFPKGNNDPIVNVSDKNSACFNKSYKVRNLNWKIKPKIISDENIAGFIFYTEDRTDIEYLSQVYKMVTGQDEIPKGSIKDYAEDIKNYLENIIACMPGNVYWMDKNCVYLGCNENAARFAGLRSRKEIIGTTYEDMREVAKWSFDYTQSWKGDDLEVIATGKPKLNVEEKPVLMPDGKEIFYLTSRVPLFDKNKNVIGVVGVSIDITDRKVMERELQLARERAEKAEKELLSKVNREITGYTFDENESSVAYVKNVQNYLENIIARMPGNIYWMDKNHTCLGCNDNVLRFLGLKSRKEVLGATYADMESKAGWISGHTESWTRDDIEAMATGKPKVNFEERPVLMPNGEEIYYLTNREPLFDDKNNVVGVVGVSIDISDRKRAEKLQREKEIAEKTAGFMGMLAGSIAHEIKTPLSVIGVNIDLLKINPYITAAKGEAKSTLDRYFYAIKYAINLATQIVNNILIMLKTLSSGTTLQSTLKKISISEDLQNLLKTYPFLEHEKSLIKVDLKKINDFAYRGDKMLTQHILFNLTKNALYAIKAVEKGEIRVTLGEDDTYNLLMFTDTGAGISEKELPGIFERFTSNKMDSAGMGLAFCKMVMQLYGGDVICRSKKGRYTEFILKFPKVPG